MNGKGDRNRTMNHKAYEEGWTRAFRSSTADEPQITREDFNKLAVKLAGPDGDPSAYEVWRIHGRLFRVDPFAISEGQIPEGWVLVEAAPCTGKHLALPRFVLGTAQAHGTRLGKEPWHV